MLARQTFYPLSHSSSPTSTLKAKNNLHWLHVWHPRHWNKEASRALEHPSPWLD
jgi:hypothetical protein